MSRRPPKHPPTRALVEELESRILLSADLQPVPLDLPDTDETGELAARVEMLEEIAPITESETSREEVVFVDAGVANRDILVTDLQSAPGRSLEIVLLDAESDGVQQITDFLADREGLDAVHVISHGTAGSIQLGDTWLDVGGLDDFATRIETWGDALSSDADLLLYGCDLAGHEDGAALIESLSKLTGADVAASLDPTGHSALGGDWELEHQIGEVETSVALGSTAEWAGVLANQPPENSLPGAQSTPVDTPLLLSTLDGNGVSISDPDAGDAEIELTITVTDGTITIVPAPDSVEINSETTNLQTTPRVARDAAGNTIVVWASVDQDGDGLGIFAQRYDTSGQPVGGEFQVNTEVQTDQSMPAIAMNASGTSVVVWQSMDQDGDSWGIYGQRLDASGAALGDEIQINTETAKEQMAADVAIDAEGNFVVVWETKVPTEGSAIYAQRFDASGGAQGAEIEITASPEEAELSNSAVAMSADGDFVVVWQSVDTVEGDWDIRGQRFDAAGVSQGPGFVIDESSGEVANPDIAMDASGDFAVVWQSLDQDGEDWGVFARRFDSSGAAQGPEFLVNTTTSQEQSTPSIAMDADGDFAIAWQSRPGNLDIFAQRYASDGSAIGAETLVNTFIGGDQNAPDVAMNASGDAFIVWEGKTSGSNTEEVSGRTLPLAQDLTFLSGDGTDDSHFVVRGSLSDLNRALEGMVFTPTAGFEGTATLTLTSNDLGNSGGDPRSDTDTLTIRVGNEAPTLDASGDLTLDDVVEDEPDPPGNTVTSILSSGGGAPISDPDGDPQGIAVVGVDDTNGTWQYSIDAGSTWQDFGSVSDEAAVLLDGSDHVRFVPAPDHAGNAGDLTFRAWDQTDGSAGDSNHAIGTPGGSSAFSEATETASLDVLPVNDAPTQDVPGGQTTSEDTALVFSIAAGNAIQISDVDAGDSELELRLTAAPGSLTLATSDGLDLVVGDGVEESTLVVRGTLSELNAALDGLIFQPNSEWTGTAQLHVQTSDLGNTGTGPPGSALDTIEIGVMEANDAPTHDVPGAQTTPEDTDLVFSTADGNAIRVADVDAGDADLEVQLSVSDGTLSLGVLGGVTLLDGDGIDDATMTLRGTVTEINAALDGLRFQPDADWSGTAQLEIETSDLGNTGVGPVGIAQDTIDISVTPVNDAPTHDVPGAQTGVVGTSLLFSAESGNGIVVSDVDASVVQVTLRATDGTVTLASLEGLSFGAGDGAQDTVVTFSGSLAAVNAALDGLRFEPSAPGTAGLEITTDDLGGLGSGGARSTASTIAIEVAAPDLPPEIEEETPPEEEPTPSEEETGGPGPGDTPTETSQVESIPPMDDLQEAIDRPGAPGFGMPSGPLGATPAAEAAAVTSAIVAGSDPDRDTGGSRKEIHARFEGGGLLAMTSHLEQSLDRLRDDLTRSDEEDRSRGEVFFSSIRAAALATSTGVLTALLRGGSLLALTFSSLPVWKGFDPLAVLALTAAERKARRAAMRADQETEDEAVAQIFEED
jgi:hypothetical protein